MYQNNSLVTLEDIGESDDALLCITNNTACCSRTESPGGDILGDWHYPNDTGVANNGEMWDFYRDRGLSVVRMNRRRGGEEGIYRCMIPVTTGVDQTIYIGLYNRTNTGEWCMFTPFLFNHSRTYCSACVRHC